MANKADRKKRATNRNRKRAQARAERQGVALQAVADPASVGCADPEAELKGRVRARMRAEGFDGAELAAAAELVDAGFVRHGRREVSRLRRARGADGLVFLWEEGRLAVVGSPGEGVTAADHRRALMLLHGGLAYRAAVEASGAGALRSQLEDRVGGGGCGTSDGIVWGALDRAKLGLAVDQIDRDVTLLFPGGRELTLLREVAGLGRSLRSVCGGGSAYPRALAALVNGLGVAARAFRIPGSEGEGGKASQARPVLTGDVAMSVAEVVAAPPYEPVAMPEGRALADHVRGRLLGPVDGEGGGS